MSSVSSSNNIPEITITAEINKILPDIHLGVFVSNVNVIKARIEIIGLNEKVSKEINSRYNIEEISSIKSIEMTKNAYRKLGKDPSRYRPSAEALCRRIANGKELFYVNNIVDILNIISIETGFSIGGYDIHKIEGAIRLGIGMEDEPYTAIGRGVLNIHNLPVLRDDKGAFGSPTSDSVRTMITPETTRFMMVIFDFEGMGELEAALRTTGEYYHKYADIKDEIIKVVTM